MADPVLHVFPQSKFPQFTDTDDYMVLKCDCKSQASVDAVSGAFSGTGEIFSDDGVLLGDHENPLNFTDGLTTAQKAKMERGFTLTCWVEKGFFSNDYVILTTAESVLGIYFSQRLQFGKQNPGSSTGMDLKIRAADFSISDVFYDSANSGSHVRVDMTKHGGMTTIYLDYYPILRYEDGALTATPFDGFVGIGATQFNNAISEYRVKDFFITTHIFQPPYTYGLSHVCSFGHSYFTQGDYSVVNANNIPPLSYSSASSVVGSGASSVGNNVMFCPAFHSHLTKNNKGLGNGRLYNHAKGGMKLSDATGGLAWQIAQDAANHSSIIDTAIIMVGANEIANNAGDWDAEYGPTGTTEDWETLFQAQITALVAVGATKILLLNQPYFSESHATASGQAYRDRVDGCNTMIDSLVAANSECYLVNVKTLFNDNQSMWGGLSGTDWAHPNHAASADIGVLVANKSLTLI